MSATTTLASRIINAKKYINTHFDETFDDNHIYFYNGRLQPWEDEYSPKLSTSAESEIVDHRLQRIFMKKMGLDDVMLGIRRFNWILNTIYTRADYNVEYTDYRNWLHPEQPFYVMNSEENVYKCISNGNGTQSLIEPTGTSFEYLYLGDGYIWKFMFNLKDAITDKFLTDTWIPVPVRDEDKSVDHLFIEANTIEGDIVYIHVDDAGKDYTYAPEIHIRGDGSNTLATSIIEGEKITHIQVNNRGEGYNFANVEIFGNGTEAKATAMIAPPGGHGSDAIHELGAFYVVTSAELIGDEDGVLPIIGTYRNVRLVEDTKDSNDDIIISESINTLSDINISNTSGKFMTNELVIGEDSLAEARIYFDPFDGTTIHMFRIWGEFIDGENIHGQETGEVCVYEDAGSTYTDVDILSGDIIYKENIIFITRREIQIEKFVFVVEF